MSNAAMMCSYIHELGSRPKCGVLSSHTFGDVSRFSSPQPDKNNTMRRADLDCKFIFASCRSPRQALLREDLCCVLHVTCSAPLIISLGRSVWTDNHMQKSMYRIKYKFARLTYYTVHPCTSSTIHLGYMILHVPLYRRRPTL